MPLEQTKDIQDAMVAGAADKSKIEANRTNRHSGSAGGDQMMSIELIFDDGRTVSRNQPGHENDKSEKVAAPRSTALEFLSEHELSKDDFDRRLNSVGKARDMLLCAAVDIGAEPHKLAALNIGRDDVGSALGVYLLGPELAQTIGAKGTKTFGDQMIPIWHSASFGCLRERCGPVAKRACQTRSSGRLKCADWLSHWLCAGASPSCHRCWCVGARCGCTR